MLDFFVSILTVTAFLCLLLKLHKPQISHRLKFNQSPSNHAGPIVILKSLMLLLLPDLCVSVKSIKFQMLLAQEGHLGYDHL